MYDHNDEFNHLAEERRQILLITPDVKQIQNQ